ncbi:MAG: hypothetical protein ACREQK_08775, partial [Candidatus Binatia bacterium]
LSSVCRLKASDLSSPSRSVSEAEESLAAINQGFTAMGTKFQRSRFPNPRAIQETKKIIA